MKLDTSTIQGYAEMTAEQKVAALEALEYDDAADLKKSLNKATSEAAEYKRKLREKQTEDEAKAAEEAERAAAIQAELERYKTAEREASYVAKMLGIGVDEESAKQYAKGLPAGITDEFWTGLKKSRDALESSIRSDNVRGMPRPANGGSAATADNTKRIGELIASNNEAEAIHLFRTQK